MLVGQAPSTSGGGVRLVRYPGENVALTPAPNQAGSAVGADTISLTPFILSAPIRISHLGSRLTGVGAAGSKYRMVLYDYDPETHKALNVLGYTASIDGTSALGDNFVALNANLDLVENKRYMVGHWASAVGVAILSIANASPYGAELIPPLAGSASNFINNNTSDMGQKFTYTAQAFSDAGVPPNLSAATPNRDRAGGSAVMPFVMARIVA